MSQLRKIPAKAGVCVLTQVLTFAASIIFSLSSFSSFAKSTEPAKPPRRDPRQMTVLAYDVDGTIMLNVGSYKVFRVDQPEGLLIGQRISGMPKVVEVPVNDFEGNTGPKVRYLLGKIDENHRFIPSTAQEPIQLSNGETLVPGYYYLDAQRSYDNFRPHEGPVAENPLSVALAQKLREGKPFLLEALPFLKLGFDPKYADRLVSVLATMRGHEAVELQHAFHAGLRDPLELGTRDWPLESFFDLTNPAMAEYARSKVNLLRKLYNQLLSRQMTETRETPHYLVFFENDLRFIRQLDDAFRFLASRGIGVNPVVPILVNLAEPEVLANPDGIDWNRNPLYQATKMSRVTIYRPEGKIERSDDLLDVMTLTLQMSRAEAEAAVNSVAQDAKCAGLLVDRGILKGGRGK